MIKEGKLDCIEIWKNIILSGNTNNLKVIIHENATFYSPVVFTPQVGKKKVMYYLSNAVKTFEGRNFIYTKTIKKENLYFAEFEAKFDTTLVNGIDLIDVKNNMITEFKVFLRPLQGLEVVWKVMRKSLSSNI